VALNQDQWRLSLEAYPLRLTLQTRYGDMDANAHLNNVAIARLMEESRVRFHYALQVRLSSTDPSGIMIVHASIDYLGEGAYPGDVEAGVAVASIGSTSYRLAIGLFQRGKAFALADSVMVNLAEDRSGSAPVGPELRERLEEMKHG
jgi:acyl-CoA thioester hydrolase